MEGRRGRSGLCGKEAGRWWWRRRRWWCVCVRARARARVRVRVQVEESVMLMMTHPEAYDRIAQVARNGLDIY